MTSEHPRAVRIVNNLNIREAVGLLLHPMIEVDEDTDLDASHFGGPSIRTMIADYGIRFFCLHSAPEPGTTARTLERLQEVARTTGSHLPLVFSTDPRHSFMETLGATHSAQGVSQWPEPIGFGAIADPDLVQEYANIVRQDYLAMGIRMALHPQVDLATEPRWARQAQSFSSDANVTSVLLEAFLHGLQGEGIGPESVAATVKHFPGGGAQLDGEDPHFPYGREQVYPAGRFEDHLSPFRTAIAAGAAAIMPYYGMPVGLRLHDEEIEQVGFAFNKQIITGLLRDELGFTGVILSDFGLVTDMEVAGKPFPARAWGVEHLTRVERVLKMFDAGIDQLGGELDAPLILRAIERGLISAERVRESATRLVSLMIKLGVVDDNAPETGGLQLPRSGDVERAEQAQGQAMTVLTNGAGGEPLLPLRGKQQVHLVGVSESALPEGWTVAEVNQADFAVIRLPAPYEPRDDYFLESGMQQGSLCFSDVQIREVQELTQKLPTVVVVTLTRPAVLAPFETCAASLIGEFGVSDSVLLRVLSGRAAAKGRLPFDIPRSMDAVRASAPDAANDTADPVFRRGDGLSLN